MLSAVAVVVQAVALASVVDRSLLHHASLRAVTPAIVVLGLAILARAALHGAGDLSALRAADRVVATLRRQLLQHALALGPGWLAGERPGELSLTATRGLRSLHTYYARYLPQAAAAAVIPVILLVWVATQDWLSFVVVIALVLAVPVTMIAFGREATRRSERQWRRLGSLAGRVLQLVEGLPTLRAFGREAQGRREVEAATEGVRTATMRTLRVAFLSALSMDMIAGFGVGFVAMVLGLRLLWGELDLADRHGGPPRGARDLHPAAPRRGRVPRQHRRPGGGGAGRRGAGDARPGLDGDAAGGARPARPPPRRQVPARRGAGLTIDGLGVRYEDRARAALAGVSLQAAARHAPGPDRTVGVGQVDGAGRAAALRRAERGHHGLRRAAQQRRARRGVAGHFSWLPQRPHLFNATLAENLRLGAPDASDEDLHRVLEAVGLADLLANLPAGLRTAVGHDGLTLSSGERQRVALARALLRPAPVLLLDEPTASLDPPTVARLAPAIEPWLAGRTVVVAAHEPLLLPHFDAVVALPASAGLPLAVSP